MCVCWWGTSSREGQGPGVEDSSWEGNGCGEVFTGTVCGIILVYFLGCVNLYTHWFSSPQEIFWATQYHLLNFSELVKLYFYNFQLIQEVIRNWAWKLFVIFWICFYRCLVNWIRVTLGGSGENSGRDRNVSWWKCNGGSHVEGMNEVIGRQPRPLGVIYDRNAKAEVWYPVSLTHENYTSSFLKTHIYCWKYYRWSPFSPLTLPSPDPSQPSPHFVCVHGLSIYAYKFPS